MGVKTVLVVDDSPTIRNIVQVYLSGMRCSCVEAADGQEALEKMRATAVDLVIADLHMPKMNGLDFVRAVRGAADEAQRRLPIILLTSEQSTELLQQALQAGANEVVKKPIPAAQLREAASALMGMK